MMYMTLYFQATELRIEDVAFCIKKSETNNMVKQEEKIIEVWGLVYHHFFTRVFYFFFSTFQFEDTNIFRDKRPL